MGRRRTQSGSRSRGQVRRGFTLIEAVMAIVILSIAIAPLMIALERSAMDQVTPIRVSRARWLATERLEEIIADRYSATRGYAYLAEGNYSTESPVATDPDFTRSVSIVETAADLQSSGTGYKTVTVTVSWTGVGGASRTLQISTVLTSLA